MSKTAICAWIMAVSLMLVVAITLILCLMELGAAGNTILCLLDAAAAVTFSICPTLADKWEAAESAHRLTLKHS